MNLASPAARIADFHRRLRVSMADMDIWWSGYAATVPGMAGSWLSFIYYGAGVWALISVALRRFPIDIPGSARPFVFACLCYFAAMLLAGLVNGNLAGLPRGIASATAFLFVPLLISRLRFSAPEQSFRCFCAYAPLGILAGAAVGGYQFFTSSEISGGAGNPNVYAVVMADLGVFALAGLFLRKGLLQTLGIAAFALASMAVLASTARTIWPMILLTPLLLFWFARRHLSPRRIRVIIGALVVVVGTVGVLGSDRIATGFQNAIQDIDMAEEQRFNTSLGMRMALYQAGLEAAREQPLLGYGPQNKMDAAIGFLEEELSYVSYSHLHNAALDTMVAAGIPGLLALIALFVTPFLILPMGDERTVAYRFALSGHMLVYALSGTTGALFTHDILTICFLLPIVMLAATAGRTREAIANRAPAATA